MIHFQCPRCAHKLTVPDAQVGKVGRCPRCRSRITVAPMSASAPVVISEEPDAVQISAVNSTATADPQNGEGGSARAASGPLNPQLLNLPPTPAAGDNGVDPHIRENEALAKLRDTPPPEYSGERRLPWPLDILLYPANGAGLMNLAIIVGIPVLLTGVQQLVFLPFLGLMFLLAKLAIAIYAAWYWAECTHDSAQGGTRAPQVLDAAGYGDKWSRVSYLLAVYILFVLPAVLYPLYDGRNTAVFGLLLTWAIVFFPMGLLAMVMHEALYVLNPLFLLGSIFRTFLPYVGLLSLIVAVAASLRLIPGLLMRGIYSMWLGSLGLFLAGYSSLLAAHILGRFYWRYRERLGWDL